MRYDRSLLIANAIAAAMLAFALLRLMVFTGKFHWNVACGFAPFVLAFIALRQGAGRTVGGIAILLNGLLVLGGLVALVFSTMPARGPDAWNNMLAVALSASLLLAGLVNVRVLWHAFPPALPQRH